MDKSGGGKAGGTGGEGGELRVRIRRGGNAGQGAGKKLLRQIVAATKKAGKRDGGKASSAGFHRGRGGGVRLTPGSYRQRVTVKARIVKARGGKGRAAMARHMGYIEKEGAGPDGGRPVAFDAEKSLDANDLAGFVDRCSDDRHSFRLIVSPENARGLDMERYTRDFAARMERDLGTSLDWVAAAHYDTDNPHVHMILRGVDDRGADLIIARDYVSVGMRERAQDVATIALGRRSELDVVKGLQRDVAEHKLTAVDRRLVLDQTKAKDGLIDLGPVPSDGVLASRRSIKLQRLKTLEQLGYAEKAVAGRWKVVPDLVERLQQAGQGGDRARVIAPHMATEHALEQRHLDPLTLQAPVRGVVIDRGLANALHGTEYVIVASPDGALNYAALSAYSEADADRPVRVGEYVELRPYTPPSAVLSADRRLMEQSGINGGIYDPAEHLAAIHEKEGLAERLPTTPEEFVRAHERRCEALASRAHLERLDGGKYRVPADLAERIEADPSLTSQRAPFLQVVAPSRGRVDELASVPGYTALDDALTDGTADALAKASKNAGRPLTKTQNRLRAALAERQRQLVQMGVLDGPADNAGLPMDFKQRLVRLEVDRLAQQLAPSNGRYVALDDCRAMAGTVTGIHETSTGSRWAAVKGPSGDFTLAPVGRHAPAADSPVRVALQRGQSVPQLVASRDFAKVRFAAPAMTRSRDRGLSR